MSFIKIVLAVMLTIFTLQGEEMKKIETVWNEIEQYWKIHDKKLVIGEGDTQSDIDEFEKKYDVVLPEELVYSLKRNYQNSRHGRKNEDPFFLYPWFGSNIGIDLLSIDEIDKEFIHKNKYSGLEDTKLPYIKTVFLDNLFYKDVAFWHKKWIPIVYNQDIDIVLFIDLDKKSNNYLKVVGFTYVDFIEVDKKMGHFRFALIAENYLQFIIELKDMFLKYQKEHNHTIEETKAGYGFEFYYYERKFKFPKGFWTEEYEEKLLKQ